MRHAVDLTHSAVISRCEPLLAVSGTCCSDHGAKRRHECAFPAVADSPIDFEARRSGIVRIVLG